MNYRHAYHAGNFADVFKHVLLVALLTPFKRKEKPFVYADTHAGLGWYDLSSAEAERTGEREGGIERVLARGLTTEAGRAYEEIVRAEYPPVYPGSPAIAAALLRPQDRLLLNELHPEDHTVLKHAFARDPRAHVHHGDGWQALKALLPPKERRGLVLIDPPFEEDREYERMASGLAEANRRFETGTFACWYPIKDRGAVNHFCSRVVSSGIREVLTAELSVARDTGEGLTACGLLVVRPPYGAEAEIRAAVNELLPVLRADATARAHVKVLVPE